MSDPIITVENLTKAYRIWSHPSARLQSPLLETAAKFLPPGTPFRRSLAARAARGFRDFFALQEVSFTVRRGEATGIIGRNGSGKSTLLQLVAGTLTPTAGRVAVRGRVSALLELGSGFNPDFTGRENVYLNGAILGLSRREIDARYDAIAAFAEIDEFLDQPVKTYSSGMMMRLAFAVAVNVEPDVLIVDEALSVGDVFFTQKCFEAIRAILQRGATLIFVSHDMAAVQNLCSRALLLHHGRLAFDGRPDDCVARYFSLHQPAAGPAPAVAGRHPPVTAEARQTLAAHDLLPAARSRHGNRRLEFMAAAVLDPQGVPARDFEMMQQVRIRVLLRAREDVPRPSAGIQILDRMANLVFAAGTTQLQFPLPALAAGSEIVLDFKLTLSLYPGDYTLGLDAAESDPENPNLGNFYDRVGGLGPITISRNQPGVFPFYGIAQLPMEIAYA
jgi:homopolymeric O-antigen transport system ATP-binding protein